MTTLQIHFKTLHLSSVHPRVLYLDRPREKECSEVRFNYLLLIHSTQILMRPEVLWDSFV